MWDTRGIEAILSGLEGPKFSFFSEILYLRLRYFREYKFLPGINKPSSEDAPTVQRGYKGRCVIEPLVRGDAVSVLDVVQRHSGVLFCRARVADEQDVLDILNKADATYIIRNTSLRRGARNPSVYSKGCVEGTRAIIGNSAQGVFRPSDYRVEDGSCRACSRSQTQIPISDNRRDELVPPASCSSTTSSGPKLEPNSASVKLNESLHHVLPLTSATTEYHRMLHSSAQPLGPYVMPPLNAESILSAFNTPFNPHELKHPSSRSRSGVRDEYECRLLTLDVVVEQWSFKATASF